MTIKHRPGRLHADADALSRPPDTLPECIHYKPNLSLKQLPCKGCAYCQRAHRNWTRFLTEVNEVIPLAKNPNRQQPLTNVSAAMVHLFSTPEPETLALPQASDNNQDVSDLPDVTCNQDLTVSAPSQKQQEVNNTWFSTHIELICTPTTAQVIASDQNSCHVAAVTQSISQALALMRSRLDTPKQEEAIEAPIRQEEEIPMEDRHIIILQNGLVKRMVPVCSLRDLRSITNKRFPGRGEGVSPTCNTITGKDPRDLTTLVESREIQTGEETPTSLEP
ncbi:Hypothetical predicted protein [Mytilus galloprovincialis]|uniref:Uncharacterized protein n=1 Tax=Mytilus galloprovincialis TaxID=29158 RepID=A0A8B6F0S3_MYTGA|nr:Hypothetical predicted protein [Mytilus galloprovincialis]